MKGMKQDSDPDIVLANRPQLCRPSTEHSSGSPQGPSVLLFIPLFRFSRTAPGHLASEPSTHVPSPRVQEPVFASNLLPFPALFVSPLFLSLNRTDHLDKR